MKVIILAAGRGSRMGEGTKDIPKCMMKLFGKTLIEQCVETLIEAGFNRKDIGIVTGYKAEKIQIPEVTYFHNDDWENTNMFMSLTKAEKWLNKEECIICYSDIKFNKNPIQLLMSCKDDFAITYYTNFWELWEMRFENPLEDLETFKLDGEYIKEIGFRPISKADIEGQYMGLIKVSPRGWNIVKEAIKLPMKKSVEKLDMTTLLEHLVQQGNKIKAIQTSELWLECDNQHDIEVYEKMN